MARHKFTALESRRGRIKAMKAHNENQRKRGIRKGLFNASRSRKRSITLAASAKDFLKTDGT